MSSNALSETHKWHRRENRVMIWSLPIWSHGDGNCALVDTLDGLIPLQAVTERLEVSFYAHARTWDFFGSCAPRPPVDAKDHDHERWPAVGRHGAAGSAHHSPRAWERRPGDSSGLQRSRRGRSCDGRLTCASSEHRDGHSGDTLPGQGRTARLRDRRFSQTTSGQILLPASF